jgi:bacteriocin biosynthesis cyclodehydratase domain-containing protein
MRPQLKPALRRLWRDPTTLQLGVDPACAVVLSGLNRADAGLLDLLDGSRELAQVSVEAERRGHQPGRVESLLTALADAEVLDDAAVSPGAVDARRLPDLLSLSVVHRDPGGARRTLAARGGAAVEVLGAGRVGASVAMLLSAAGVGRLSVTDPGPVRQADYAPGGVRGPATRQASRAEATRALLANAPTAYTTPVSAAVIDARRAESAVVLAPPASVIPPEWLAQVRHRPHLPVVVRETVAAIGPLVLPGRSPCLRCVELTRGDRDPVWPALAAQLVGEPPGVEACDVVLASAAAALVALNLLTWIDRRERTPPPTVGGILELSLLDLRLRRRTVHAHPGCGCGAIDTDAAVSTPSPAP